MDLREAADELYGADLADFMATRSRLAAEARSNGDRSLAKEIGALRKPTVSAWVLDHAVRALPDLLAEIDELGSALRGGSGTSDDAELRELGSERRRLIARATAQAASAAEERGVSVSDAVRRELETAFQAAIIDAGAAAALRSGLLVRPISASGLDAVDVSDAVALPEIADAAREAQGAPDAEVIEFRPRSRPESAVGTAAGTARTPETETGTAPRSASTRSPRARARDDESEERRRREVHAAREAAEQELEDARADLDDVRTRLRELGEERERLEDEIDDLTEQLESARQDLAGVDRRRGELRRERTRAERAVSDAERRAARLT